MYSKSYKTYVSQFVQSVGYFVQHYVVENYYYKQQQTHTAVHQGLSKYLTAQDTHVSPTSTNHSRTLSSHGNLLSFESQSTIEEYKTFSVPSIE